MAQLIIVILSIVLTAVTIFASLNYMPSWMNQANDTYAVVKTGLTTLETAYAAAAKANGGVAPAPNTGLPDGGLSTNFSPYYGYLPKAPRGYSWKYGRNTNVNTDYFCLYSSSPQAHEGIWRGMNRVRNVLSDGQYFILAGNEGACSAANGTTLATPQSDAAKAPPGSYPAQLAVMYLVKYLPGP